jgi:hypothetical protein
MESDAVAAARRRLESQAREQTDRLALASRQFAETRRRTEEHNQKFVRDVHRLVRRLRESNAARTAGATLSFRDEDAEPAAEEFPGPAVRRPPRAEEPAGDEPGGFLRPVRERPPPAPAAERPQPVPPARRVPPRRPPADDDGDDLSGQSWLR